MIKVVKGFLGLSVTALFLSISGCGGGGSGGGTEAISPEKIVVSGAVQKGPFIVGSTVLVNKLDNSGNSTSETTVSEIQDSIGSFKIAVNSPGPVQLIATGYYFNEITGEISNFPITLRSIYEVGERNDQKAFINILTHLSNSRIKFLMENEGIAVPEATIKAENELILYFHSVLPLETKVKFSDLTIYNGISGDVVGNEYLLAMSTAFYKYAEIEAKNKSTSPEAELSLILNELSSDFASDGQIIKEDFLNKFSFALRSLNPKQIKENLQKRSQITFGQPLEIPNLDKFFGLCAGTLDCPWSGRAPLPIPTGSQSSASSYNKLFIFGGRRPNAYDFTSSWMADAKPLPSFGKSVYEFDPESNGWQERKNMPEGFVSSTAISLNEQIFVIGGYSLGGQSKTVLAFNPIADTWETKEPRPIARDGFASALHGGKIYLIGGRLEDGSYTNAIEEYDTSNDTWKLKTPAPFNIAGAAACVLGDTIYLTGGRRENSLPFTVSDKVLAYDVIDDIWSNMLSMNSARMFHKCESIDNRIVIFGGVNENSEYIMVVEEFDQTMDAWTPITFLPSERNNFSTNIIGGKVYITGGWFQSDYVDTVEVFDRSMLSR